MSGGARGGEEGVGVGLVMMNVEVIPAVKGEGMTMVIYA